MRTALAATAAFVLGVGCRAPPPAVVLPAPSTTPRYAIATADPDEIALVAARFKLRNVVAARGVLYFEADEAQVGELRQLGYQVTQADAEAVDHRVLRVRRRGTEERLREEGVTVVMRERDHWIVSGTLAQLRRLVAAGYRLSPLARGEPRPRWVRIVVSSPDDVQRIANFEVDIFSVADTAGRYTILGAALDMHIDRLQQAGFTVQRVPRP